MLATTLSVDFTFCLLASKSDEEANVMMFASFVRSMLTHRQV
jgi:hypothetical protein